MSLDFYSLVAYKQDPGEESLPGEIRSLPLSDLWHQCLDVAGFLYTVHWEVTQKQL